MKGGSTILVFFASVAASVAPLASQTGTALGQRHSGDSGYGYYAKPSNPILNIDDQTTRTWSHPRLFDLMKMSVFTVEAPDPTNNQTSLYEGVALKEFVPNSYGLRVDAFQNGWEFRDRLAISGVDLDSHPEMVVAYAKNGERLAADHPFCLIARNEQGDSIVVKNLSYIRLDKTR